MNAAPSQTAASSLGASPLKAVVYGAAVGDALGVPYEFLARDTFECTDMASGGAHQMPKGTFSDDTSMLLATCDSIRACRSIDVDDMRERFRAWLYEGAYTPDGVVFDVGNTTRIALDQGVGGTDEYSNGNGSLMRIAPLAFTHATEKDIRQVSAITHGHEISQVACVVFVGILREALAGEELKTAIGRHIPEDPHFAFLETVASDPRDKVGSSGYVLDTLQAALWCALHAEGYRECVLEAVNLGSDSDTTACVAGALAGALWGYEAIPARWIRELRGKEVIEECLF